MQFINLLSHNNVKIILRERLSFNKMVDDAKKRPKLAMMAEGSGANKLPYGCATGDHNAISIYLPNALYAIKRHTPEPVGSE
jgi:hypothetical protein